MITLTTVQIILLGIIFVAFPLILRLHAKTNQQLQETVKSLKTTLAEKEKVIAKLSSEVGRLVGENGELSGKCEMLEEALNRAGVTPDVWNTEDKINDA